MPRTSHAAELVATVAKLYSGKAIEGDFTQLFVTGHQVWQAQQTLEFASHATLDDLAASSVHFSVPLALLRRERELDWSVLEIAPEYRAGILEAQRASSATALIGWIDCLSTFGLLSAERASELTYQLLDLRDDTPGATAEDGLRR